LQRPGGISLRADRCRRQELLRPETYEIAEGGESAREERKSASRHRFEPWADSCRPLKCVPDGGDENGPPSRLTPGEDVRAHRPDHVILDRVPRVG
jgi:hypothetical protein